MISSTMTPMMRAMMAMARVFIRTSMSSAREWWGDANHLRDQDSPIAKADS
jgi:cation transport regulator ChaB